MHRRVCTDCRLRKIRCVSEEGCIGCNNCTKRNLRCSLAHTMRPFHRNIAPSAQSHVSSFSPPTATSEPSPSEGPTLALPLLSSNLGLDVGTGTPDELVRETELTQALLLLYFTNFDDIHVMLDQTSFMRQYTLGNAPKMLLFALMALGIRYSHAPFQNPHLRSHWGEPLFNEARNLLKDDFDHPSVITAQTYVLLATYHLTFGGTRKAWMCLGFSRNIVSLLQLDQGVVEPDCIQTEMSHRLVATIALMENIFTPSVNIQRGLMPIDPIPILHSEEDFDSLKACRQISPNARSAPSMMNKILALSSIYFQIRQHWDTRSGEPFSNHRDCLQRWEVSLPHSFLYSPENMRFHQEKFRLRPYTFMHLLRHHAWDLVLFESLTWPPDLQTTSENHAQKKAYHHASQIVEILQWYHELSSSDIHNPCFGQIATTTLVLLVHQILSAADEMVRQSVQRQINCLRQCVERVKQHSRLFNWVVHQIDWFMQICTRPDFWQDPTRWKPTIYHQMMTLGTSFERLDNQTAGMVGRMESVAHVDIYSQPRENQLPTILQPGFIPHTVAAASDGF